MSSLFLFLAFSLRFLELAFSYGVASGEMRFLELAFLSLICIILTEFRARRISGTTRSYFSERNGVSFPERYSV